MLSRRNIAIAVIVFILIAGFAWAFRAAPVPVDLAMVDRGPIEATVADEGVTRIREVFTVSAPVAGRVLRATLDEGDPVRRGETVVAVIEPQSPSFLDARLRSEAQASIRGADAALNLAKAELVRAEAELEFWKSELARDETLRARGTISAQALDQTRLAVDIRLAAVSTATANVEVRRQDLARARAVLLEPGQIDPSGKAECCLEIMAPVSGQVLATLVESEQIVSSGAGLIEIGDPHDLEILVDLLSADAVRVAPGAVARITRWGGDLPLEARVRRIEPAGFTKVSALGIDEQRVNVILDITSDPELWRNLGHAYRVFAEIRTAHRADVPRIPMSALFRQGKDWAVFVMRDDRAELEILEIGLRNAHSAEVVSGPEAGTPVILHPSDRLSSGTRISPRHR